MAEFLKALGDFFSFLSDLLATSLSGLYLLFTYLINGINDMLANLNLPMMPTMSKFLGKNSISGTALCVFFIYIVIINMYSFHLFISDKKKSKKPENQKDSTKRNRTYDRISEKKLLMSCFWGGAFGGFMGMRIAHHKTLKKRFSIGVPLMFFIQLLLFSFICGFFGFWLYLS